jgi:ABC-type multidrug transport system fused ATPase/permease subunit
VPQEPTIFRNTLRFNLDPAASATDLELALAMQKG